MHSLRAADFTGIGTLSPFPPPALAHPCLSTPGILCRLILAPILLMAMPGDFDLGPKGKGRAGSLWGGGQQNPEQPERKAHLKRGTWIYSDSVLLSF